LKRRFDNPLSGRHFALQVNQTLLHLPHAHSWRDMEGIDRLCPSPSVSTITPKHFGQGMVRFFSGEQKSDDREEKVQSNTAKILDSPRQKYKPRHSRMQIPNHAPLGRAKKW
jgi:hypothetical protein